MKKVFLIAEAGVNHNGNKNLAFQLIDAAVSAGADAVKFQTFKAEKIALSTAPKAQYQLNTTDAKESQLEMLKKLELSPELHIELIRYCQQHAIQFMSTAFDFDSLAFLSREPNIKIFKIPSGEITNGPLLLQYAKLKKPLILSTGMSTIAEIEQALSVLAFGLLDLQRPSLSAFKAAYLSEAGQNALKQYVSLLHCTSRYPTPAHEVNLLAMDTMSAAFQLPVGYSDHTQGIAIPIAAVARGACIIEKHFTLDRSLPRPDHKASLEPDELKAMVVAIREIEQAMGDGIKKPFLSELETLMVARKSLLIDEAFPVGEII